MILNVGGNVAVSGNSTVNGNSTVHGNSTVNGNSAVTGNLAVTGNETIGGNLVVSGTITPAGGGLNPVIAITTTAITRPVTAAESGSTFAITKAAVAMTLNLPTPALGLHYTFTQVSVAAAGTIIINSTTNGTVLVKTMGGLLQMNAAGGAASSILVGERYDDHFTRYTYI